MHRAVPALLGKTTPHPRAVRARKGRRAPAAPPAERMVREAAAIREVRVLLVVREPPGKTVHRVTAVPPARTARLGPAEPPAGTAPRPPGVGSRAVSRAPAVHRARTARRARHRARTACRARTAPRGVGVPLETMGPLPGAALLVQVRELVAAGLVGPTPRPAAPALLGRRELPAAPTLREAVGLERMVRLLPVRLVPVAFPVLRVLIARGRVRAPRRRRGRCRAGRRWTPISPALSSTEMFAGSSPPCVRRPQTQSASIW